jgi:ubiquinone/menaquinone biosynthesis C-methylase UbiE
MLCAYLLSTSGETMTVQAQSTEQIRDAWESLAAGFDDFVSPLTITFGEEILSRLDVRPGMRFLDVAAGSGALALPAARRGAGVVAVDVAPTMVDRLLARAQAESLSNVEGRVMDGEHLEFADATFDVSASLNGVSLFPDLAAGLSEMVRVTRPDGCVVIACFGGGMSQSEYVSFFLSAVQTAVPSLPLPPLDPPPLAFQVADPDTLRAKLLGAGLHDVRVENASWKATMRDARHYWDAVTTSNPFATRITAGLSDEQSSDVLAVLDGMLRERSGGGPTAVLHSAMNIGIGTR